ncbi:MAG TPA: efflux transporter outer membrane subunit [Steroidobacteraceae bacterium]|jgi:NodT family efflux transporter outer membrane factor (OMF) lipoprotein|nr:efflux transporter outer membrane subunit [Steroidobacteraceae bacterium]
MPRTLASLAAALTLAACAVGPNFKRPAPPAVTGYTPGPLPAEGASAPVPAGEAQRFAVGKDLAADWWSLFHSARLNDLIEMALAHNPDLEAAKAALAAAHETMLAQRGAYYPNVSANFSATHQSQSVQIAPTPNANIFQYNLFTPQLTVSYVPDVFGLNRRTVESLRAQEQEARYQMIAAYNTLTSNVVVAAIQEGALELQVDATHDLIDLNRDSLKILQYQLDKGYASRLDVATQESQLAQIEATLPPLRKQLVQQQDLLAVLTGRFPSQSPGEQFDLLKMKLPEDLPLSLPSALVEQRPDVLQAEANMHDASAKIGIAVANRLPNIVLSADTGSTALAMSQLFTGGTGFWTVGAAATAPLFAGGTLYHQERAAREAYAQAAEQYRSTVLTAFQNVADTLTALDQDADAVKSAAKAADAATVALDLAKRQWQDGYAAYLALLSAEQTYQQSRINLAQAQGNRYADTAALFQALGGGWWHRADLASDHHAP